MLFAGIRSTLLVISINSLFISIYTKNAFTQKALSNPPSASHSSRLNRKLGKDQELLIPFWTLEPGWGTQLEVRNNLAQGSLEVTPICGPGRVPSTSCPLLHFLQIR
ncbi:MAG: hypothetical protein DMG69_29485 [Acidobacteria bacterium]|nr:MAG: hypothetical protein DMG69_29485 [Acidobacteriota bacterium]